jgi:hypothetical protein
VVLIAHAFPLTLSRSVLEGWMTKGAAAPIEAHDVIGLLLQLAGACVLCASALRRLRANM